MRGYPQVWFATFCGWHAWKLLLGCMLLNKTSGKQVGRYCAHVVYACGCAQVMMGAPLCWLLCVFVGVWAHCSAGACMWLVWYIPWKLLLGCMLLNKTSGKQVRTVCACVRVFVCQGVWCASAGLVTGSSSASARPACIFCACWHCSAGACIWLVASAR